MTSDDDGRVGYHMAKLRSLVEEEGKLSTALILSSVLKIHTDVIAVRGSVNTISAQLDTMHSMLGPSKTDQLKTILCITNEPWTSRFRTYDERRINGTGEWLLQLELLQNWACEPEGPQTLAIEAVPNFGKTYLASSIIIHLRDRVQRDQKPVALAYYFFDKSSKSLSSGDIIRSIIYQFCTQNLQFFEIASPIIQQEKGSAVNLSDAASKKLWSSLIANGRLKNYGLCLLSSCLMG